MPVYMPKERKPERARPGTVSRVPELISRRELESARRRVTDAMPPEMVFRTAAVLGLAGGFGGCLSDTAESVRALIDAIVSEDMLRGARKIIAELGALGMDDVKEAALLMGEAWSDYISVDDPWKAGSRAGYLMGYMLCEACIAAATAGSLTALKGGWWGTRLGGKIKGLRLVKKVESRAEAISLVLKRGGDEFEKVLQKILRNAGGSENGKRIMRYLVRASEKPGWEHVARDLAQGGNKFTGAEWVLRYIDDRGLWKKTTAFELRTETGTGLRVYDALIDEVHHEFKSWKSMNGKTFLEQVRKDYSKIMNGDVKWVFENKGGLAASKDELIEKLKKVLDNAAGSEYLTLRQIDKLKNQLHLFVEFR